MTTIAAKLRYNRAMSNSDIKKTNFKELMDELGQLESTIESRELDDLDQLMDEVSRAEKIIDELRSRLEAAEKKIEDSKSDDE